MLTRALLVWIRRINALAVGGLAMWLLWGPAGVILWHADDPAATGVMPGACPDLVWSLHHDLAARYPSWARERIASGVAGTVACDQIAATEWPLFGSVFFLWASENLQAAWEEGAGRSSEPRVYARAAIDAAAALVMDPGHAHWVRRHWGEEYLKRENCFYRMMVIAACTAHIHVTGEDRYRDILTTQIDTLAAEIDAAPAGLLDDYPNECYPTDVLMALACIRRADTVLGTDHSAMLERARRAFVGGKLSAEGLPPYAAVRSSGVPLGAARGCGNAYAILAVADLWPEVVDEWYPAMERQYWQRRWGMSGWREFSARETEKEWGGDVDAGPVLGGFGCAASAFGLGAARRVGRFDHAAVLWAQMLAVSGWVPGRGPVLARQLSNAVHAPLLGESAVCWLASVRPMHGRSIVPGDGTQPPMVWVALGGLLALGTLVVYAAWRLGRRPLGTVPLPVLQGAAWAALLGMGLAGFAMGWVTVPLIMLLAVVVLPRDSRTVAPAETEGPGAPAI